jgi:hypothetical protein
MTGFGFCFLFFSPDAFLQSADSKCEDAWQSSSSQNQKEDVYRENDVLARGGFLFYTCYRRRLEKWGLDHVRYLDPYEHSHTHSPMAVTFHVLEALISSSGHF